MTDLLHPPELVPLLRRERRLTEVGYLAFPFATGVPTQLSGSAATRAVIADRGQHVRQQIEQVLFTAPSERPHRPDWGIGVEQLVFEPAADSLRAMINQRLTATLADVLRGEVDAASLSVDVEVRDGSTLMIKVRYALATVNREVEHLFERSVG